MSQPLIDQIYREHAVVDASGARHELQSEIDACEGRFLRELISARPDIVRTLEVGCAFGLSSLHITGATAGRVGAHHVIVDPNQSTVWSGIGVHNLRRAGTDAFELIEAPSELALPRLLDEGVEPFDLIFIDGWHTFDHTLVDMFYANRLIKMGGYIVVDDCGWPSVSKAISYFSRYPCLRVVGGSPSKNVVHRAARFVGRLIRPIAQVAFPHWLYDYVFAMVKHQEMMAFEKVSEDGRRWDWFRSF
ncbi:class I SAM-dependent methyltransferase [Mycolicibacterium sp.]|uniref:O-methyltransferase n=1 Tax=Mycolicibacterium sp. TaxID=2320850 RepID=UPI001A31C5C1|nr:class I SAM-dependent methyltransferase [Mycolicibacterium sp.]MBJ7339799.1 class I SAM-dependent methyltransferase [Mycolicibacterium sp.]